MTMATNIETTNAVYVEALKGMRSSPARDHPGILSLADMSLAMTQVNELHTANLIAYYAAITHTNPGESLGDELSHIAGTLEGRINTRLGLS